MFISSNEHSLDFVIANLPTIASDELRPDHGKVFVVRNNDALFLRCFYQGREQLTKHLRHAMPFDNLQLAASFGRFWQNISHDSSHPLFIAHVELPNSRDIKLLSYGKSRTRPEPTKPVWRLLI